MARRQTGKSESAGCQRHGFAVEKFCPAIGCIDVVGQPGKDIVTKFGFDAVTPAGPLWLEGSLVADKDQFARQVGSPIGGGKFHFFHQSCPKPKLAAPKTGQRLRGILNYYPGIVAMKAAAEVQKQVRSLREWVVREGSKNQIQFWTGDGLGSGAGDGLGGRPGLAHSPPEIIESSPQLTPKPVSRSDFLMGKPAQIGYLDLVVVRGAQSVALFLVEEADGDAIESALKAKEGLG